MRSRFRLLIVWLLVAAFAAAVPAGTLDAALASPCAAAAQGDGCCPSGGSPDPGCAAHCAASCRAPILALAAPAPAAQPQGASAIGFAPPARHSFARAPDGAPPKPFLV